MLKDILKTLRAKNVSNLFVTEPVVPVSEKQNFNAKNALMIEKTNRGNAFANLEPIAEKISNVKNVNTHVLTVRETPQIVLYVKKDLTEPISDVKKAMTNPMTQKNAPAKKAISKTKTKNVKSVLLNAKNV